MPPQLFVRLSLAVMVIVLAAVPFTAAQEGPQAVGLRPDAPSYAVHGLYWVGVLEQAAETPSHPTQVLVWYPALNPDGAAEAVVYEWDYDPNRREGLPIEGHALMDAEPDSAGGPYPLVVYVHGRNGGRTGGIWLCEHLASYGFVVMSIDQDDNAALPAGTGTEQARLHDVTWQIDYARTLTAGAGVLAGMIDTDRVAITGHSVGGATAFEAGGTAGDARVDAVVPLAPFGLETVDDFTLPTLILIGTDDEGLSSSEARHLYRSLESTTRALVLLQLAHHWIFWYDCDAAPWYTDHTQCSDPVWDMARAHDLINHFTTAFLLNVLKGDAKAGAALAPDVVHFPGITYEAQGF